MKKVSTQMFKGHFNKAKDGFLEHQRVIYNIVMIVAIVFLVASVGYRFSSQKNLSSKDIQLSQTNAYSFTRLASNDRIKDIYPTRNTLSDMIKYSQQQQMNIVNRTDHRLSLSVPYDNFLQYIYTPSINIWKDPFTLDIDTSLMGKKYIENNPYDDIALIDTWTDFFKDVGMNSSYNTITSITIDDIQPATPGYFTIPIAVDFETPDKRSFLLLINKISMTSYTENIALINEFTYYLWNTIKETHADVIQEQTKQLQGIVKKEITPDVIIGYLLRNWIHNTDEKNILITPDVINKAIRLTAGCVAETDDECFYHFRTKMATIPYLAYGVGRTSVDQVEGLRYFYTHIPPIISIENFSFEKSDIIFGTNINSKGYVGKIKIKVYGMDVKGDDLIDITNKLGSMCFVDNQTISTSLAQSRITKYINDMGIDTVDTKRSQDLNDALEYINRIATEYDGLSNFKKVVKGFEIYRTLKENNLCDIVSNKDQHVMAQDDMPAIGTGDVLDDNEQINEDESESNILDEEMGAYNEGNGSGTHTTTNDALQTGEETMSGAESLREEELEPILPPESAEDEGSSSQNEGVIEEIVEEDGLL